MQTQVNPQLETFRRRMPIVVIALVLFSVYLLWKLASFQWVSPEVLTYMENLRSSNYNRTLRLAAARGLIYDRHGELLAVNTLEYAIGISPNLVTEQQARSVSTQLATLLELDELTTYARVTSNQRWTQLKRPVSAEVAEQVAQLELPGVTIEPIPRRSYPQGTLAAQVLGFVNLDLEGHYGIEGYYQDQLSGRVRERLVSNIPFEAPQSDWEEDRGSDVILTIDRDIQFLAESELQAAMTETGASSGTIIIMNPRNGDVLALANYPSFDPNAFYDVQDQKLLPNPAISSQFEPGSIMKVITVASALEKGTITPEWTYFDNATITVGGVEIPNWDRQAHGTIDVTQILVQSLNVGAAQIALTMGPTDFYGMMDSFGIGRVTGIDLEGEIPGTLYVPGDAEWSESHLGTNSFGQGMAITPLQLLTAVNAIANDGLMMQPHIVSEIRTGSETYRSQSAALGRPISAETARIVAEMMVATVRDGVDNAVVDGYTIAGKSGTAEIPTPIGYEAGSYIMTFTGFLPADDPQVSVLVKLDRPKSGRWASQVVAPVFQRLAERLVILLEIPNDEVRRALTANGASVSSIQR